jgi:flavin reductase (DIM6/NTAB) family NADH-FMN oxidoreductase RutF
MKKNLKPSTMFFPMPVLIIGSYDENGKPGVMNAAWGGVFDEKKVILCLSDDHQSSINIDKKKCFTIAFADEKNVAAADYVGIESGTRVPNKFEKSGLHAVKGEVVDAPIFEEFPLSIECKVLDIMREEGTFHIVGEIVNVQVDEEFVEKGKVNIDKMRLLSFDTEKLTYRVIGESVAKAWGAGLKLK